MWFNHHNLFNKARVITPQTYLYNGIWLFFLTLVPFTTNWVGTALNEVLPEFLYVLNLLLWSIAFQVMDNRIIHDNPGVPRDTTNTFRYRLFLYGGYGLALVISFIWPIACLFMLLIFIVLMAVGFFRNSAITK